MSLICFVMFKDLVKIGGVYTSCVDQVRGKEVLCQVPKAQRG